MKKKAWLITGIIILVIALVGGGLFVQHRRSQADEMAEEENLIETVEVYKQDPISAEGVAKLSTDDHYYYQSDQGQINQVLVEDGQMVEAGSLLFTYTQQEVTDQIQDLERAIGRLQTQRANLVQEEATAKANLAQAQMAAQAEEAEAEGQPAEDLTLASSAEVDFKSQIAELDQEIEDNTIQLNRLRERLDDGVKARSAGKVIYNPEALNDPSIPLVRVVSDDITVQSSVDEYDFYALKLNRPVKMLVKATGEEKSGEITAFDEIPQSQHSQTDAGEGEMVDLVDTGPSTSRYAFAVKANETIQPGFSVEILIQLPGFTVPESALIKEGDKHYVMLNQDGQAQKREVTVEKMGLLQVIMSGVKAGDEVVLYPETVSDGDAILTPDDMEAEGEFIEDMKAEPGEEVN